MNFGAGKAREVLPGAEAENLASRDGFVSHGGGAPFLHASVLLPPRCGTDAGDTAWNRHVNRMAVAGLYLMLLGFDGSSGVYVLKASGLQAAIMARLASWP